ncbi:MAG: CxxxxCH/CxxCH domain-containing protein [Deltaproteobacteria bacterium]|nr:CxxxxCH/CxxCH domain-containing protein [Deltaproteobacteria bacterium]
MKLVHLVTMLLLTIGLWACSQGNDNTVLLDSTGKHPALWAVAATGGSHPAEYLAKQDSCAECHGSDLRGGTTKISCFSASRNGINCHPAGPSGHPAGFAAPGLHGVNAKSAAVGVLGMAFCKNCHGADFRGAGSANRDCIGCHRLTTPTTNAPHSPAPWRGGTRTHVTTDPSNAAACAVCHSGGANSPIIPTPPAPAGTPPDCFNNTLCHGAVGHAGDPQPWVAAANHGARAKTNLGTCQSCHATPASGVNPRFNVAKTNLANGCENCHLANTAHPTPWLTGRVGTPGNVANTTSHATAGSLATACALCHGSALNGPAGGGTAPSCMSATAISGISCHATSPAANPSGCSSCHGNPPNGATAPNRAFAHAAHTFSNVACAACHNNLGFGTIAHADGTVNVALSPTFQAQTGGAPSYSAGQCTNVSCHGGQTTPPWASGTINVDTNCTLCHASGTTQNNSYNSGDHAFHINDAGLACTACHDTTNLSLSHFTHLETPAMEGPASATIGGGNTNVISYDPVTRSCAPSSTGFCHNTRIW